MVIYTQATRAALVMLTLPMLTNAELTTCQISDANSCAIDSLSITTNDGSVSIYPGGDTRCAFDDYIDTETTFQSNSTYFFQVFPAVNKTKKKLLLFFQGGGACVDKYTCDFTLQCQLGDDSLISTRATVTEKGIMNRQLGDNVFNDFNIVYLPYCTGDLFVGNKYLEPFENMYSQGLENKQCLGQNKGMHLNGYNNTMAVIKWALDNYPNPEQIVIGGYSAGSLGAQLWSTFVAKAWNVETKATKFQVLADSYVGVFPEFNRPASSLINFYGGCRLINFPDSTVTACEAETATAVDLMSSLMRETLTGQWLFIDSIGDETQRMFYELIMLGIPGFPFTDLRPADEFYGNLTAILDVYSSFMDVTRFNIEGEQHVWLTRDDYRNATSLDGQFLGDVLVEWLSNTNSLLSEVDQSSSDSPNTATITRSSPTTTSTANTPTPMHC